MIPSESWSTQQLTEFLAVVTAARDERSATQLAVERAAEALEAEVGAMVAGGAVTSVVGFPLGRVPVEDILAVADGRAAALDVPGVGACRTLVVPLAEAAHLLLARSGDEGFLPEEANVVRGMGRAL